jgi:uncharacterized membrane protein YesL
MNSAKDYIKSVLDGVKYDFGDLMVSNVLLVLLLLPIITIPPAFAGLYYSTSKIAANEFKVRQNFFSGFKKYFRVSYAWFFLNLLVVGFLLFNIDFSIQLSHVVWLQFLRGIYWVLLGSWLLIQVYTFPFLIQQDKPSLFLALRNSVILWFKHVIFSVFLSVAIIILVVISFYLYPLWFVITASLIGYLTNLGVVYLLSKE